MSDELALWEAWSAAEDALNSALKAYAHSLLPLKTTPREWWPAFIAQQSAKYRLKELTDAATSAKMARDMALDCWRSA